jgi:membrane-bound ClpP family serine protease
VNPFALFLIVVGTAFLFAAGFMTDGWRVLGFIGTTVVIAGFLVELGATLRKETK